jgi:hypothetical protein
VRRFEPTCDYSPGEQIHHTISVTRTLSVRYTFLSGSFFIAFSFHPMKLSLCIGFQENIDNSMAEEVTPSRFEDDECESFFPSSPSKGIHPSRSSTLPTKAKKKTSPGFRRNKKHLCFVLVSGAISLTGFLMWINARRKTSPETIIEVATSMKVRIKAIASASDATVSVENIKETSLLIPETLLPVENLSLQPSVTPAHQTDTMEESTNQPSASPTKTVLQNELNQTSDAATFGSEKFLSRIQMVVKTAMTAILEEYGQVPHGYYDAKSFIDVPPMFAWDRVNLTSAIEPPEAFKKSGRRGNGGWTSDRSWNGLVLRLVQAILQQSEFTVVLGGHSAAAGHGNHFKQSYLMQFHKVMAPVFRQLGVTLVSRNQAQGGLGTVQSSLGFSSIYGSDIDLMLWDSGKGHVALRS